MPDALDDLAAALAATRAAGTARFTHVLHHSFDGIAEGFARADARARDPRDGSLRGELRRLERDAVRGGLRRVGRAIAHEAPDGLDVTSEGTIDLAARRYVEDSGHLATLVEPTGARDRTADGAWDDPDPDRPFASTSVLWLLDALTGATSATAGTEAQEAGGVRCDVLDVRCDLSLAARATPARLPTPPVDDFDVLLAYPLRVCVGDGLVRGVEDRVHALVTRRLELFDHGAPIDPAVWAAPPGRRRARD